MVSAGEMAELHREKAERALREASGQRPEVAQERAAVATAHATLALVYQQTRRAWKLYDERTGAKL